LIFVIWQSVLTVWRTKSKPSKDFLFAGSAADMPFDQSINHSRTAAAASSDE
jgi:hypothetical protein